jgi:hypothetical protein
MVDSGDLYFLHEVLALSPILELARGVPAVLAGLVCGDDEDRDGNWRRGREGPGHE